MLRIIEIYPTMQVKLNRVVLVEAVAKAAAVALLATTISARYHVQKNGIH